MSSNPPPLVCSADRILSEAIRNLIDGALDPKVSNRGYLITSNVESVTPVAGEADDGGHKSFETLSGKFAYCERGVLEMVKDRAKHRVDKMNQAANDEAKFPIPVKFGFSVGEDHCVIWFERPHEEDE